MDAVLHSFADYASKLTYRDLPADVVAAAKERLLDTLGVAIGAYDCETAKIARTLAQAATDPKLAGRIIGSKKLPSAELAAFVNSCMIRYDDLNDIFPGSHPSDMLGALFAIAPRIGASGEQLVTSTVVAYEICIRLAKAAPLRDKGWDQSFGIAVGTVAGLANLMGLSRDVAREAIAITAVGNPALRATRAGQLSMWKGCATAYAVRNAVFGIQLAAAGMTGPEAPFTGRHGFAEMVIGGPLELKPLGTAPSDFLFPPLIKTKYWPVANSLQTVIWAGIELRKRASPQDLASIEVNTYRFSYMESGSEPAKWDPKTRETADHSIPYIFIRAMLKGTIDHSAFEPEAYLDAAIRPLMAILKVNPDPEIDRENKDLGTYHLRVAAKDKSGKSYEINIVNPIGHEKTPFKPQDFATKFVRLCEPRLGEERTAAALEQWKNIETVKNTREAIDGVNIEGE